MRNEKLRYLTEEYRLAEKRLRELRGEHIKLQTSLEVAKELEKDLKSELQKAEYHRNYSLAEYWRDLLENYFAADKDRPKKEDIQRTQEKVAKNQRLIAYYERKLKIIRKLLGVRETELLESFQEKNILMGGEHSSMVGYQIIQESQEEEERIREERKNKVEFDKM